MISNVWCHVLQIKNCKMLYFMALTTLCKQSSLKKCYWYSPAKSQHNTYEVCHYIYNNGNIRSMAHAISGRPLTQGLFIWDCGD